MKVFPKLFIGSAMRGFLRQINDSKCEYSMNYVASREDLIALIELFSSYKNYRVPVVISDISYLNRKDQSLLLKFIDDTDLNLVLLASRDNVLDTIISRVKEFRKFYYDKKYNQIGFLAPSKARELLLSEQNTEDISYSDRLLINKKYNSILTYDDYLVKRFSSSDKNRILNLLEYQNE